MLKVMPNPPFSSPTIEVAPFVFSSDGPQKWWSIFLAQTPTLRQNEVSTRWPFPYLKIRNEKHVETTNHISNDMGQFVC